MTKLVPDMSQYTTWASFFRIAPPFINKRPCLSSSQRLSLGWDKILSLLWERVRISTVTSWEATAGADLSLTYVNTAMFGSPLLLGSVRDGLMHYLPFSCREDFSFTAYATISYIKTGPKANLLRNEKHSITLQMRTSIKVCYNRAPGFCFINQCMW